MATGTLLPRGLPRTVRVFAAATVTSDVCRDKSQTTGCVTGRLVAFPLASAQDGGNDHGQRERARYLNLVMVFALDSLPQHSHHMLWVSRACGM